MARQAHEGDNAVDQITGGDHENSDAPRTGTLTADELRQYAKATSGHIRQNPMTGELMHGSPVNQPLHRKTIPTGSPFATGIQLTEKELPFTVTPSLNPGLVDGIEHADEFPGHLQPAKTALSFATESLKAIDEAYQALMKDTSLTPALRQLRLEPGASKAMDSIAKKFDKAIKDLNTAVAQLDTELNAPVMSANQSPAARELRDRLFGMSDAERNKAIEVAFANNDEAVLHAALGAHPLASGLNPMFHATMHRRIREKRNPETMRRREATLKAIAVLERAAPTVFDQIERAARFKYKDLKGLKEKADNSAAALAKLGSFPVHHD